MKLEAILKNSSYKPILIQKDEILFSEGELCNSIVYVLDGSIKGVRYFSSGHESTLRILSKNDIIGLSLVFSSYPYYNATFTAITDSYVYRIPKKNILDTLGKNPLFLQEFLSLLSDNSIDLNHHIRLLSYKTIRERLCFFFYSEYQKGHSLTFRISSTKTEIADLLNVERPSLSYEIHKLIKEGILLNQGHEYTILDIKKIEEAI